MRVRKLKPRDAATVRELAELRTRIDRVTELFEARLPAAPEPAPIDPDDDLIGVSEFQEFESVWAPVFEH